MRTLTLARAVAPLTGRKLDGAGTGVAAIAAIIIKWPNMTVMVTVEARHGYHLVRDCSETEQFDRRIGNLRARLASGE